MTEEGEAIQAESLGQPLAQKIEAKDAVAEAWRGSAVVENGDGQTVQADVHTERGQGLQDLAERQVTHEDTLGAGVGQTHGFVVGHHLNTHAEHGIQIVVD